MVYACGEGRAFLVKGDVKLKKKLSPEVNARWAYIASHTFTVDSNSETGEVIVKVEPKDAK